MNEVATILPIAVRAYTLQRERGETATKRGRSAPSPTTVLVLDTETTTDKTQRLTFGSWQVYIMGKLVDEGLFHGDDLPDQDRFVLEEYIRTHPSDRLRLLSRREFLRKVFWKLAYKGRALVVGFNLPFDLSRLGVGWGVARGGYYAGGYSLPLWDYEGGGETRENRRRPRLAVKNIDSKRALIGFTRPWKPDAVDQIPEGSRDGRPDQRYTFPGHFLDLRTLAFALTNQGHSLASACAAFGVEHEKQEVEEHGVITPAYIDYNRRDVLASWELFVKLREEYARHPIGLPMTKAFSPAALGKAYLAAKGVEPILTRQPDFPKAALGQAMAAYYGGRTEARLRCVPVPVVYLDFLSMYPTVNSLMGLWKLLTAERIEVVDATDEVRTVLASITLDDCCDPASWRRFVGLVRLAPEGDILPTRARYGNEASWQIGVNPLTANEPLWYTSADAVAATLLTGKPPRVLEAIRFAPLSTIPTLRPVELRRQVRVDPRTTDFFRTVIEERRRLATRGELPSEERKRLDRFLKVLANATSYGIFAEMNRQELPRGEKTPVEVWGVDDTPFTAVVTAPEEAGAHCFPPLAACIAGGARLMLALLERCVTDAGGTYAMCDTDSMAIVATERGELVPCPGGSERMPDGREAVRALSWAEVAAIQQRFAALNPYDRDVVPGSVLKIEDENFDAGRQRAIWCYAISAKRYALFTLDEQGRPVLLKWSEHGLGHLLNPTDPDDDDRDWIRVVWEGLVTEALGQPYAWPTWLSQPAIGRITASNPALLRPFAQLNQGKPYAEQIKPCNFLLSAQVAPFGHPEGADPRRFHLVAPYEANARKWQSLPWTDVYSGQRYRISTGPPSSSPNVARVKTHRDVIEEYRRHPEAKSADATGRPCDRKTEGLLRRRPVIALTITHVGKESNRLEDVQAGLIHDPEEVYTEYADPRHDPWHTLVLPVLKRMTRMAITEATGLSRSAITEIRSGRSYPRNEHRDALTRSAGKFAREQLRRVGEQVADNDLGACFHYLAHCKLC